MKKITRRQLQDWVACYSDEEIAGLVPPRGITPAQVLDLDIPGEDKLWVLLHDPILPVNDLRLLACIWAAKACKLAKINSNPIIKNAIKVARNHARGLASDAELYVAHRATVKLHDKSLSSRYEAIYAVICATTPTATYQQNSYNASESLIWTMQLLLQKNCKELGKNFTVEKEVALCLKQTVAVLKKEGKL